MKTRQMLNHLMLTEGKTLGEGKRILSYSRKLSKGEKLTLTDTNFITKLYNKYCVGGK
jgi:hypothetical protein